MFAGVSLNGAGISQDNDETRVLYGNDASFQKILTGGVPAPEGSETFLSTVKKYSTAAKADEKAENK